MVDSLLSLWRSSISRRPVPEGRCNPRSLWRGAGQRHGAQYRNPLCQQFGSLRARSELPLGLPKDPKVASEIEAAMPKALTYIENILSDGRPLLGGDNVSVADCTLQSALQFARFGKVDVIADWPGIRAWDERYRQRPAAQAVLKF